MLVAAACGITANTPARRLSAVPPEGGGPEHILLRRPPHCNRPFRACLAGGMPRLHHHIPSSAAAIGSGEDVALGPLRWIQRLLALELWVVKCRLQMRGNTVYEITIRALNGLESRLVELLEQSPDPLVLEQLLPRPQPRSSSGITSGATPTLAAGIGGQCGSSSSRRREQEHQQEEQGNKVEATARSHAPFAPRRLSDSSCAHTHAHWESNSNNVWLSSSSLAWFPLPC
uniref:Uncharacterized protein n=1 Tax=Arundo donax TaxID=35708 RepID=A0A0A9HEI7_ARUDO